MSTAMGSRGSPSTRPTKGWVNPTRTSSDADWNDGVEDWIHRRIDLGSITHEVDPSHALRLRLQFDEQKMWVAMSGVHPSSLELTLS